MTVHYALAIVQSFNFNLKLQTKYKETLIHPLNWIFKKELCCFAPGIRNQTKPNTNQSTIILCVRLCVCVCVCWPQTRLLQIGRRTQCHLNELWSNSFGSRPRIAFFSFIPFLEFILNTEVHFSRIRRKCKLRIYFIWKCNKIMLKFNWITQLLMVIFRLFRMIHPRPYPRIQKWKKSHHRNQL